MKIEIRNNRKELVLTTDEKNFENDIRKNEEKIKDIAWTCNVEYADGTCLSDSPYQYNAHRVVVFNGKTLRAEWNIQPEYKMNDNDIKNLISYIKSDLN